MHQQFGRITSVQKNAVRCLAGVSCGINRLSRLTIATRHQQTSVRQQRTISQADVDAFTKLTGDANPIHAAPESAANRVPGAMLNALTAGIIGSKLPGPGTVVVSQEFSFPNKCEIGEPIELAVELVEQRKIMRVTYECKQAARIVFVGTARLVAIK